MNNMIKALIFDCDGLLIDTETPWYIAFREVYREHQVDIPLEMYAQCIGNSDFAQFNPYDYLEECIKRKVDRKVIDKRVQEIHTSIMKDQKLLPGVENYLKRAKELGLKIGLASSSRRAWVEEHTKAHHIYHFFDTIHTKDEVEHVKPHPELYLQSIQALGIEKHEVIAFEDSLNGLKAAKEAGIKCVIVPNEVTACLPFDNYDVKLSSMLDLELDEVLKKVD
jgi:putative hydrolase of the HAD superfamily